MNETISQYWLKAKQYWQQINKTTKVLLVSIVVVTILTIALIIYNFSKTEYALAYTDLSASDAAAVKEYLESENIPYQFGTDGTSIWVPSKLVTDVKIDVAGQDLVQNGSQGFGIFRDNISGFGMTDHEFSVLSVDARAGEIQKLINSYQGVVRSQVLLTIPEESVFINSGEPEESLASAVITFQDGFRPDQDMIDSIYNLIKTGVENLPLENITVSDQNGVLLPSSELSGGLAGTSSVVEQQFKIKKMFEADIQKSIHSYLSTIYGANRVAVNVVATLNFDQINSQSRIYTPVNEEDGTGIVRSEQIEERSSTSEGGGQVGGVPGTGDTDVPNYPGLSSSSESSESEEMIATRNYEINEMTQTVTSSPYVVKDLTIFAGIEPDPNDPESLSEDEVSEIKRILTNIVSTSLANNSDINLTQEQLENKVSVMAQSFRGMQETQTASANENWTYYAIGGVALAIAAASGVYLIMRRKRKEEERALEEAAALEAENPFQIDVPSINLDQLGEDNHQIRNQLEGLAKKKPEEFVNLLRTWIVEE